MALLTLHHARQLSDALAPLYEEPLGGPDRFARLSKAVDAVIDSEQACFDAFDNQGRMLNLGGDVPSLFTPPLLKTLAEYIHEHPLFAPICQHHHPDPLKITDLCASQQFYRTTVYNECYRLVHITHQLATGVQVPGLGFVTCSISRSRRDFSETERTLLAFLQPHLVALLRPAAPVPPCPLALGLTPREADVLHQLVLGREDKAIAEHCGISPRTVQVHLRNLYGKLGVVNRTAAVRRALAPSPNEQAVNRYGGGG